MHSFNVANVFCEGPGVTIIARGDFLGGANKKTRKKLIRSPVWKQFGNDDFVCWYHWKKTA